ncbi:hypothetical protein GWK16_05915 [Roseomonas sp. JC162]|uniref:PIG-L family deacetylase n=1 Tax=Neoroseomonas marina TaxID=1232220 RepID=A0A848EBT8_9PROT|nr:hypothetical protein [Neoroseomonas marina]NMJ40768.1 hypothetical protein [Neoroseomonas marina]
MTRPLLIVAHPGHELRLHGWMERERPLLCILTDGSGSVAPARTRYSAALAEGCGAPCGPVFGMMPDRDWYAAILAGDLGPFRAAAGAIAAAAQAGAPVVADPVEGYNPMHDLAAALADAVAAVTGGARLTYPLTAAQGGGRAWRLDAAALARKRAAVAAYTPLAAEAAALLKADPEALAEERILPAAHGWPAAMDPLPAYERFGAERAQAGVYGRVIRYADHVRPVALALRDQRAGTRATQAARPAVTVAAPAKTAP